MQLSHQVWASLLPRACRCGRPAVFQLFFSVLSECVFPSGMVFRTKESLSVGHTKQEACSGDEKRAQEGT